MVTRTMGSTVSACLATPFKIKGVNYSIASACATSAHCIGAAAELIQLGKQDVVFAGGGEEEHWTHDSPAVRRDGRAVLQAQRPRRTPRAPTTRTATAS
jgi:3-oxoacyl-(acyl-carrier-protein) synthase